jgi:hypothetical protein
MCDRRCQRLPFTNDGVDGVEQAGPIQCYTLPHFHSSTPSDRQEISEMIISQPPPPLHHVVHTVATHGVYNNCFCSQRLNPVIRSARTRTLPLWPTFHHHPFTVWPVVMHDMLTMTTTLMMLSCLFHNNRDQRRVGQIDMDME